MNRQAALHNIQIKCPSIACYLINTYRQPSRLFVAGGAEISSQEGTTQGDPLAMAWYSVNTNVLITRLQTENPSFKQAWLADDAAAGGKLECLLNWYNNLTDEGAPFGYLVNGSKSWLLVKSPVLANRAKEIFGDKVNITVDGQRHLGAVLGSKSYKDSYCKSKVQKWAEELVQLSVIAKTQPQAAFIGDHFEHQLERGCRNCTFPQSVCIEDHLEHQ